MNLLTTFKISLRALRRNKLRSMLTGLGIIIGVGAVIALVSIGNGAQARIAGQIANLGQNLMFVYPGSFRTNGVRSGLGGRVTLTPDDAKAIARDIPQVVAVSPEVRSRSQVLAEGRNWNTTILGESADYLFLRDWPVAQGAMFSPQDVQRVAKVAVVGQTIVDQLFPDENPLGRILRIGGAPFRIIGVLARKGFNLGNQDQDDVIVVPYTSHQRRLARRTYVNTILVQVASMGAFGAVEQQITDLLFARHRLGEHDGPDFIVRNQMDIVERATATTKTMTALLGAIAGVSLLVGGIGIMNIMLVSVTERTREIGLRLAVGAHARDVLRQFLIEAVLLSLMGGLAGVGCGIGGSQLLAQLKGWPVDVSPGSVILAVAFSAVVGIFFGYYPARRAAQLDPIDALRFE